MQLQINTPSFVWLAVLYLHFPMHIAGGDIQALRNAQAALVPFWSCVCYSPPLLFRWSLCLQPGVSSVCAKSVQCWLCEVNYCRAPGTSIAAVANLQQTKEEPLGSIPTAPAFKRTLVPPWTNLSLFRVVFKREEGEKEPCVPAELDLPGTLSGAEMIIFCNRKSWKKMQPVGRETVV